MEKIDWGKELRSIRLKMGMTQDELADGFGLSRTSITNYEANRIDIPLMVVDWILEHRQSLIPTEPDVKRPKVVVCPTCQGVGLVAKRKEENGQSSASR